MDMRARIQAANDATYAAWNAHDADAVAAVFAPDAEIVDIASGTVIDLPALLGQLGPT